MIFTGNLNHFLWFYIDRFTLSISLLKQKKKFFGFFKFTFCWYFVFRYFFFFGFSINSNLVFVFDFDYDYGIARHVDSITFLLSPLYSPAMCYWYFDWITKFQIRFICVQFGIGIHDRFVSWLIDCRSNLNVLSIYGFICVNVRLYYSIRWCHIHTVCRYEWQQHYNRLMLPAFGKLFTAHLNK